MAGDQSKSKQSENTGENTIIKLRLGSCALHLTSVPFPDISALLARTGMVANGAADNCSDYIA